MADLLDIIKKAREAKGWTQTTVAKKLELGLRQYQNIEAGKFPKYKNEIIEKLDRILGTNVYAIIYEGKDEIKNEKSEKGEIDEDQQKQNNPPPDQSDLKQLINANLELAASHRILADGQKELIEMLKNERATANARQEMPGYYDVLIHNLQRVVEQIAVGKQFESEIAVREILGKVNISLPDEVAATGNETNLHKANK